MAEEEKMNVLCMDNQVQKNDGCPLVSVVVPVYNVESYIDRCVQSIIDQDYSNLEIILVDDGSPDASGQLIDKFALQDPRVQIIHKENAGVSSARNTGLEVAKGAYIAFIDGDDYVEKGYISYLLNLAEQNDCDIAVSENNFTSLNKKQVAVDEQRVVSAEYVIEAIYLTSINVAVWNKLYRHQFLKDHNLKFNEQYWYGEGMLFNIECLQYTDHVALGKKKIYHQVSNPNSAMRKFNLESNYCGIRSLEYQKKQWKKKNQRIENAWTYHYRCFSRSILNGLIGSDIVEEHKDEYYKCIKNLRSDIMVPLRVNIPLKQKLYYIVAAVCPVMLAKRNKWKGERERKQLQKASDAYIGVL